MLFSNSPYKNPPGGEEIEDARVKDFFSLGLGATQPLFVWGAVDLGDSSYVKGMVKGLNSLNCSNTMI